MATYYVTTSGSSGNNGLSEGSAWTLSHASDNVVAGDTVYIKSGSYSQTSSIVFDRSGTSGNPIRWIGYNNTINDIVPQNYAGLGLNDEITSQTNYPIFTGSSSGISNRMFEVQGDYNEFSNIGIRQMREGFRITGDFNKVQGCLFQDTPSGVGEFQSYGINMIDGNNNHITQNWIRDIEFTVINLRDACNNNLIDYNYAISITPSQEGTDYFFATQDYNSGAAGSGGNNIFEYNKVYRNPNNVHRGHGLMNKGGHNNIWRFNEVDGTAIKAVFASTYNCEFYGNVAINGSAHISCRSGAHDNIFWGNYVANGDQQVLWFYHADDSATGDTSIEVPSIGKNNIVYSCVFVGGEEIGRFDSNFGTTTSSENTGNRILNCVFDSQTEPLVITQDADIEFTNCIFVNSTWGNFSSLTGGGSFSGQNNNFFANSYSTPSGFTGTLEVNPLFDNTGTLGQQYELQSGSTLVGAGVTHTFLEDFNGDNRTAPFDLGAFQKTTESPIGTLISGSQPLFVFGI